MISELDKDHLPIWCEGCSQQGYIFIDEPNDSYFVTCKTCGWETSQVWCPKCQMGGEFIRNIGKRPSSWNCPNCKTKYELPNGFYKRSTVLFIEEELPPIVREQISSDFQSIPSVAGQNPWLNLLKIIVVFLGALLGAVVILAIGLLPLLLVMTPLPWSGAGFVATLLIFVAWWWIMITVFKIVQARIAMRKA